MNTRLLLFALAFLAAATPAFAQRVDGRQPATAVKHLEEDPDYLAKLPKVIWRRPMGPYVSDVWPGYRDGPGPEKLVVKRSEHELKILGANFLLAWNDCRGGEISEIFLFDGGSWNHVNCTMAYEGRDTIPRYRIQRKKDFYGESPVYYLNQAAGTKFEVTRETGDLVEFRTENRMVTDDREPGPFVVRQNYRVYAAGVVVCDFEIRLDDAAGSFDVRHAQMGAYLEDVLFKEIYVKYPVHFRWGMARFGEKPESSPNWKNVSEDGTVAMGSATFGVSERAEFNNRFEFWLERPAPLASKDRAATHTNFSVFSSDLWFEPSDMSTRPNCGRAYEWELHRGDPVTIKAPFSWRNRWVLAVGGPKTSALKAGAARRSNLVGARAYYWTAPALPDDATLAKMSKLGADTLVLGPGLAESPALAATVKRAHELKLRVVVSAPLDAAAPLAKGCDGVLIEGLGVMTMKPDAAGAFDLAKRIETLAELRRIVGEGGLLLGRAEGDAFAQIELAFLDGALADATVTGDAAVGGYAAPLVSGGNARTLAAVAGRPGTPLVAIGGDPEAPENRAILPLWALLARLDGPVLHALSPRLENNLALQVEPRTTPVVAWLTETKLLLVVANQGERSRCKLTLAAPLGVKPDAAGTLLTLDAGAWKETPVRLAGGVLDILELARDEVRAYEFPRSSVAPKAP
jgi:hypothetical protein